MPHLPTESEPEERKMSYMLMRILTAMVEGFGLVGVFFNLHSERLLFDHLTTLTHIIGNISKLHSGL
jgi:hypothetical protein